MEQGQEPPQGFAVGDRAWFEDGRSSLIEEAVFNPVAGQWQYDLGELGRYFLEPDLLREAPEVEEKAILPERGLEVPSEPVTGVSLELVNVLLTAQIDGLEARVRVLVDETQAALRREIASPDLPSAQSLADLESRIVTQLSEIQNRGEAIDVAAGAAAGDNGLLGFLEHMGGFLEAPSEAFLEAVGAYIVREIADGLSR